MASYTSIMSAVDAAVLDAKKQVINEFMRFLEDKIDFDEDMKGYFAEFIGTLKPSKKTKKGEDKADKADKPVKAKRAPSAYNMFISEKMAEIKKENPALKGKELMKAAIVAWNEKKAAAATATPEPEPKKKKENKKEKEPEPESEEPESGSESETEFD
jgi:hypothetical protein